jgi:uncharacterized paraquat-inducible protein A
MRSRRSPVNPVTRIVAAIVVMAFSLVVIASGGPLLRGIGLILAGIGLVALLPAVAQWRRERPDPYDLSRLWEEAPEEGEPEEVEEDDGLLYCHRCGAAMSKVYSICPECGTPLGS